MTEPDANNEKDKEEGVNMEDAWQTLFKTSASGTGDEELLRIASKFALQLSGKQIRAILYLQDIAIRLEHSTNVNGLFLAHRIRAFLEDWIAYKQNNNSDTFVMRALDSISLRKFIGENSVKVNIEK